jgi:phosphatidylglycerol:prolipoprotein diacylglycerol transferase
MIPYFEFHAIPLGPISIQVWGLFVALGIVAALALGLRECKRLRLDPDAFLDLGSWILLGAFIGARFAHVAFYASERYLADPLAILKIWNGGWSSVGGIIGGALAGWIYARRRKLDVIAYADLVAFVLPLGYGIGRIGCFLIHDHPGTLSHSFLAVQYPGGSRLDHGLLLSLTGFAIFGFFLWLRRRSGPAPAFAGWFLLVYGSVRFGLDFYRAADLAGADARYAGLTPAQYACFMFVLIGAAALARRRQPHVKIGK